MHAHSHRPIPPEPSTHFIASLGFYLRLGMKRLRSRVQSETLDSPANVGLLVWTVLPWKQYGF